MILARSEYYPRVYHGSFGCERRMIQPAPSHAIMRDCFIEDPSRLLDYTQLTETSKRIDTLQHDPGQLCFKQCKQHSQPLPY